ncbi:hypothetical protein BH23BAC1_BH23BAC1_15570 [soil metagenome]
MKLIFFRPPEGGTNFGDELNLFIWEKYFPKIFDNNQEKLFFGIGTIFGMTLQYPGAEKIIFGSGVGKTIPKLDNEFKIYFVRGPKSAKALNLDKSYGITDPAVLLSEIFDYNKIEKKFPVSYIPHYTGANKLYEVACKNSGINYIDPRGDLFSIMKNIAASEKIFCEAMHGAIVSDAFRVPWIPTFGIDSHFNFKWRDWTESMEVPFNFHKIKRLYFNPNPSVIGKAKSLFSRKIVEKQFKNLLKEQGYLSNENILKDRILKIKEKINQFKSQYSKSIS